MDLRKKPGLARVIRILPDGAREMEFENGRRFRTYFRTCLECKIDQPADNFRGELCISCALAVATTIRKEANQRARSQYGATWAQERQVRAAELATLARNKRCYLLKAATPHWADKSAIAAIYSECVQRTSTEGQQYHVDHIWPLSHPDCCGLHVPWNLRVILAVENCSKGNSLVDGRPGRRTRLDNGTAITA